MINKSLLTNLVSIVFLILGFYSPWAATQFKAIGIFAFSGAITNWLAIHMLFEKVPFLYGSGVVPSRFEEFKVGIKDLVMNQFFTSENVNRFIGDTSSSIDISSLTQSIDYDILFAKLVEAVLESPLGGMLAMLGGPAALDSVKPHFNAKVEQALCEILESPQFQQKIQLSMGGGASEKMLDQIDSIVDKRLNELTPQMVKEIVQDMIHKHLGWLVVWGGVFGGLIGFLTTLI